MCISVLLLNPARSQLPACLPKRQYLVPVSPLRRLFLVDPPRHLFPACLPRHLLPADLPRRLFPTNPPRRRTQIRIPRGAGHRAAMTTRETRARITRL